MNLNNTSHTERLGRSQSYDQDGWTPTPPRRNNTNVTPTTGTKETRKKNRVRDSLRFLNDRLVTFYDATVRWKTFLVIDGGEKIEQMNEDLEDKELFERECQDLTVILEKMQEQVKIIKDNAKHIYSTWILVDDDDEDQDVYNVDLKSAKAFKSWTFYDYYKATTKMANIYEKLQEEKVNLAKRLIEPEELDHKFMRGFHYTWTTNSSFLSLEFEFEVDTMLHDAGLKIQDLQEDT